MSPSLPSIGLLEERPTTLRPTPARHHMAGSWPATAQLARRSSLAQSNGLRRGV
jgi:hypothetical protein